MSKHARLAPSGASRWLKCPYSAQHDLPVFESPAAKEGTEAHHWAAELIQFERSWEDVPEQFMEGVGLYADVVHDLSNGQPLIVERYWDSLSIDDHGGTIDCLVLDGKTAHVIDFKYGKHDVKAENNPQLLCYAAIVGEHFEVEGYHAHIVQPNTKKKYNDAKYSVRQVNEHRNKVAQAAVSNEKRTGRQCLFCPLRLARECQEGMDYAEERGWKFGVEYGPGISKEYARVS